VQLNIKSIIYKLAMSLKKLLLWTISISLFAVIGYQLTPWAFDARLNKFNAEARNAAKDWCRLSEFPIERMDENIAATGGMFTSEFKISFTASQVEIKKWVKNSPGLQDAKILIAGGNIQYDVRSDRAAYCHVSISSTGQVLIHTYWS
jgi:hypothetical protein